MTFSRSWTWLTLVQGDRLAVLDTDCLPLVTNGRRDTASYGVSRQGSLLHRDGRPVARFTQQQVRAVIYITGTCKCVVGSISDHFKVRS